MSFTDKLTRGVKVGARRTFVYGSHGDGKSTWASRWPDPVFICTEDGTNDLDVARTEVLRSSADVVSTVREAAGSDFSTIVLDSIDWAEKLVAEDLAAEDFQTGYGQGVVEQARRIGIILDALNSCISAGKDVVIIGHASQTTVTTPFGDAYTQYHPRLSRHSCAVVSEWCDELLFTRQVVGAKQKEVGLKKINVAVDSKKRILYTEGSAAFVAKHRSVGLAAQYDLSDIGSYLNDLRGESK